MASKNYNGAPPKYLNDFSKALANEVRILLAEVGKLRDERRALQFEIAELMSVKSKFGSGGEYAPEWKPKLPEGIEGGPPPPAIEGPPAPAGPARPAWRSVTKRPPRKDKKAAAVAAPPAPAIEAPKPELPAWAQWRPNPLLAPAPTPADMQIAAPQHSGLFGPPTPPPK